MLEYDKIRDAFLEDKKIVSPASKGFMRKVCELVIHRIERGENLAEIAELDSKVYPSLANILSYIDDNQDLSDAYDSAERSRLAILKEQVLAAKDAYIKSPTPDNKDLFLGLEKMYASLTKQQGQNEKVKLVFNSVLPPEFWSGPPPEPKNPRPKTSERG